MIERFFPQRAQRFKRGDSCARCVKLKFINYGDKNSMFFIFRENRNFANPKTNLLNK